MPIDPSIPFLAFRQTAPQQNPLDVVQSVLAIREQQSLVEARRAAAEEARRKAHIEADKVARQQLVDDIYARHTRYNPETQQLDFDDAALFQEIAQKAPGALRDLMTARTEDKEKANKAIKAANELRTALKESQASDARTMVKGLKTGAGRTAAEVLLREWRDNLMITPDELTRYQGLTDDQLLAELMQIGSYEQAEPGVTAIKTTDAQGREVTKLVPQVAGAEYLVPPPAPDLVQIDTVDAAGRPVTQIVPKEAGAAYPKPPPAPKQEELVQIDTVDDQGRPVTVIVPKRSGAVYPKPPPAAAQRPATGAQNRVLNFFNRANQADIDLQAVEPAIAKLGILGQGRLQYAPNLAQTPEGQRYNQAQRAFTEARLRKDSGAAIPEHEFENDRQTYFVQPGDNAATQAQKARARAAVLASLAFESGKSLGEFYGEEDAETLLATLKARASGNVPVQGAIIVKAPNGKTYTFTSEKEAAAFKKRAGIP